MKKEKDERCWLCGRIAEEVIRDDVSGEAEDQLKEKKQVLIHPEHPNWVNTNPVCVVCIDFLKYFLVSEKVLFEGDEVHATLDR